MKEFTAYKGEKFTIEWYYNEKSESQALSYFESLNEGQQDKLFYLLKRMGDFGKINDITKFRYEQDGIYAFKPQPDRYLCFFTAGRKIIITNAFTKKSDKMPLNEKNKATQSKNNYMNRIKKGDYYE